MNKDKKIKAGGGSINYWGTYEMNWDEAQIKLISLFIGTQLGLTFLGWLGWKTERMIAQNLFIHDWLIMITVYRGTTYSKVILLLILRFIIERWTWFHIIILHWNAKQTAGRALFLSSPKKDPYVSLDDHWLFVVQNSLWGLIGDQNLQWIARL